MSLAQLSQLLPLPEEDLQQVLDYAATLSKPEAAEHFTNLLGDSPLAVDFITSFNGRRKGPAAKPAPPTQPAAAASSSTADEVPKTKKAFKKKKADIHTPQARKVDEYAGPASTAYKKDQSLQYGPQRTGTPGSSNASRHPSPPRVAGSVHVHMSAPGKQPAKPPPKQHASSAGHLISDIPSKSKSKSNSSSRSSTPKPGNATKVSIAGGTPMAGQSTALADLEAAIRALEITTNPGLDDKKSRKCNCVGARHPVQTAAPNCLSCGKVICLKEGLGPCTFCGTPLLGSDDVQAMIRELKDERGRERMAANAAANRRADVATKPAPFTQHRPVEDGPSLSEAAAKAREHRDKLLGFQSQNAQRTTVRDEAADFDVSGAMTGMGSMWARPEERARELKRQQKLMREMEWNARPEYEKRTQVVSIDLAGKKVVRRMAAVQRPKTPDSDEGDAGAVLTETTGNRTSGGGAFSGNPLLGAAMRPIFDAKGKGSELEGRGDRKKRWRRVQNDLDDNEDVILDGGVYGHGTATAGDEPECG